MRFRPAAVVLGALAILLLATLFPFNLRVSGSLVLKKFDLLSAVRVREPVPTVFSEHLARAFLLARSLPTVKRPIRIPKVPAPVTEAVVQPLEMARENSLDPFFRALHGLTADGGSVRIAYFGDSIVEGDLITQDLRANFQKTFGGNGLGYLPIASEVAPFRITVGHDFSHDWRTISLLQKNRPAAVGIAGLAFLPGCAEVQDDRPACQAWVEYKTSKLWPSLSNIEALRVFYGGIEAPATLEWAADDGDPVVVDLESGEGVRQALLRPQPPAKKIKLTFQGRNAFSVYGASWEGGDGILLDNFALRGNSGLPLRDIPLETLRQFDSFFHYRLIILHFGTNVASPEVKDYSWYRKGMEGVVRHFEEAFPESAILLIGAGDRSVKDGLDYTTLSGLPELVGAQRRIAEDTGAAFFDLFSAMGGTNAMVAWVNHKPSLAALDYTHLSAPGSRRIAGYLYNALMARFKAFEENLGR